ncbi:hypothetical protein [Streptomyces sp. Tue6028]|uniref:hypothetical protein n=1 Tax=Streptomyces sp. Tue6028 TaxID=2036037 RepID=UPI003D7219FE
MSAVRDDGAGAVYAELTGAYWLEDAGDDCRWCRELLPLQGGKRQPAADEGPDAADWLTRLRRAVLPVAVLTVAAALLVGTLT